MDLLTLLLAVVPRWWLNSIHTVHPANLFIADEVMETTRPVLILRVDIAGKVWVIPTTGRVLGCTHEVAAANNFMNCSCMTGTGSVVDIDIADAVGILAVAVRGLPAESSAVDEE